MTQRFTSVVPSPGKLTPTTWRDIPQHLSFSRERARRRITYGPARKADVARQSSADSNP